MASENATGGYVYVAVDEYDEDEISIPLDCFVTVSTKR